MRGYGLYFTVIMLFAQKVVSKCGDKWLIEPHSNPTSNVFLLYPLSVSKDNQAYNMPMILKEIAYRIKITELQEIKNHSENFITYEFCNDLPTFVDILFTVVTQWRQCLKSAPLLLLRATWESEIGYRQECVFYVILHTTHPHATEKVRKICHFYNLFIKKTLFVFVVFSAVHFAFFCIALFVQDYCGILYLLQDLF